VIGPGTSLDAEILAVGGVLYVGSNSGFVYALNAATGAVRWKHGINDTAESMPVLAGGTLFVGSNSRFVYALNAATGALEWKRQVAFDGVLARALTPAVSDGTIYVAGDDNSVTNDIVYALDAATGAVRWTADVGPTSGQEFPQPAATVADGTVYVGAENSGMYALDGATGAILWQSTHGSVPLVTGGLVIIGSDENGIGYALDAATGAVRWTRQTNGADGSSGPPPVVADGTLFVQADFSNASGFTVYALDPAVARQPADGPCTDSE
jgi:outer membrane protein assembly factor BamB